MSTWEVERIAMRETMRLASRDAGKRMLAGSLLASSVLGMETGRLTRATYYFLRGIDDLLDDDRSLPNIDPGHYVADIKQQIESGRVIPRDDITTLGSYALTGLQKRAHAADNVQSSMLELITAMEFDYQRRHTGQLTTTNGLHEYYRALLGPSIDLLLVALDSSVRSGQIGEYPIAQGRLYSVRDLEQDWRVGIYNIPSEVLVRADVADAAVYGDVVARPTIQSWLHAEVAESVVSMQESMAIVSTLSDRPARYMLAGLGRGALRFGQAYSMSRDAVEH